MARPFIEFIQAQVLPWTSGADVLEHRPGVGVRSLSADAGTGACSLLVRYPPGWVLDGGHTISRDEELFVLDGALTVGAVTHRRYGYAHLPAGYVREGMCAPDGAVVLTFLGPESDAECDPARLVERVDAFEGEWGGNFHPRFPPGAGRKWLRQDPVTGDQTWILGTMPLRSGRRPEKHPVVEEMYLLSGELVGQVGVMRAGAYFWRPPEEWHGPFGSPTGNLMLFRTVGGPLSTVYTEHEVDFTWTPEHRPILPDSLRALGEQPWAGGCACY